MRSQHTQPDKLLSLLRTTFGFQSFRPQQREVVEAFIEKRDCFVCLATGSGKSLTFVLPALATGLTVICISPLIALMQDQTLRLRSLGIKAEFVSDGNEANVVERIFEGELNVLYATPEKLQLGFRKPFSMLVKAGLVLGVAIDEAHCISSWGHDFRDAYRELSFIRAEFPDLPILACTATATAVVESDIIKSLNLRTNMYLARGSFNRPNLNFVFLRRSDRRFDCILPVLDQYVPSGEPTIIYTRKRALCDEIAQFLNGVGKRAVVYHAKMSSELRHSAHQAFSSGQANILVATIAYGMGVDHPSIRLVLHWSLSQSIESYYQEAGRAGRDGIESHCVSLWADSDKNLMLHFTNNLTGVAKENALNGVNDMLNLAMSRQCRRKSILAKFAEAFDGNCGKCDICAGVNGEAANAVVVAQDASMFLDVVREARVTTLSKTVQILLGKGKKGKESKFFGKGNSHNDVFWNELGRVLCQERFLVEEVKNAVIGNRNVTWFDIRVNDANATIPPDFSCAFSKDAFAKAKVKKDDSSGKVKVIVDSGLIMRLKDLRQRLAIERSEAMTMICSDVSLGEMVALRPKSPAKLVALDGWTSLRFKLFGAMFLEELRNVELMTFEADVESAYVEVSKTDRATCYGCNEKISAIVPKLLVKFRKVSESSKEEFARSFHLGCAGAVLKLVPSMIEVGNVMTERQLQLINAFLQSRICVECLAANDLKAIECSSCQAQMQ